MSYQHEEAKRRLNFNPVKTVFAVEAHGVKLAEGDEYLSLSEGHYSPVAYIPSSFINMDLLVRSKTKTMCPFKGVATYYSLVDRNGIVVIEDVAWSYEDPIGPADMLREHLAFYPNKALLTET